jgi:hypothetical protein
VKISLNSVDWFISYSSLSFRDFIMGIPYYGQKLCVLGDLTPKTLDNIILTPKKAHPYAKPRLLSHYHQNRSSRLGCARANGNKNGKNPEISLHAR